MLHAIVSALKSTNEQLGSLVGQFKETNGMLREGLAAVRDAAGTLTVIPRFIVSRASYDSGEPMQVSTMKFSDEKAVAKHLMTEYHSEAEGFGWSNKTVKVDPGDIRDGYTMRSPSNSEQEYVWRVTEINHKP
jgi:hypothetical protein